MSVVKQVRIGGSIKAGWAAMHANLGLMLGLGLAYGAAMLLADRVPGYLKVPATIFEWVVLGVALLTVLYIQRRDGAKVAGVGELPLDANRVGRFLLVTVLTSLLTMAGILLLVVPGVIWALKYGFASAFVLDEDLGVIESMRASAALTDGVKWQLFAQGFAFLGVILLGLLALFVGVFPAAMTVLLAWAWTYVDLRKQAENP